MESNEPNKLINRLIDTKNRLTAVRGEVWGLDEKDEGIKQKKKKKERKQKKILIDTDNSMVSTRGQSR